MNKLTRLQLLEKRRRELMKSIRVERNPVIRNIYKSHLEYLENEVSAIMEVER